MKIALFFIGGHEQVFEYEDKDGFEADAEDLANIVNPTNDFVVLDNMEIEFAFRWSQLLAFSIIR